MKKIIVLISAFSMLQVACVKLDLNPLSESSTGNFYSNQAELEMAIDDMYRLAFWNNTNDEYSDNAWNRGSGGNVVTFGTMDAENSTASGLWLDCYKAAGRASIFLEKMDGAAGRVPESVMKRMEGEARLVRAYQYSRLIAHFGDVPLLTTSIPLSEAYELGRENKETVLSFVFDEFDRAADLLPTGYGANDIKRFTRGAALALKARIALYMEKWVVARDAAAVVMQLEQESVYGLYPSYRNLFLASAATSNEIIISIPRSEEYGFFGATTSLVPRNVGGFASVLPTWELMDSYECTDGLPIDQSPLYDPSDPFSNRDPRLVETIVPFGTPWLGVQYQPHPDSTRVWSYRDSRMVSNTDNRAVNQFASYTGLLWKKGIDERWLQAMREDNDRIILRYAEVLLTYAEAKIELNEVDSSVLDAINRLRARGYGTSVNQTAEYPAVTTEDVAALRTIIKRERRVELANEGLRYMDLIRWRLAEKVLTLPVFGLPDPQNQDRNKWPFAGAPEIDEDGIPDYSALRNNIKQLAERNFDASRQYLWPIPASERRINQKLTQNLNY